MKKDSQSGVFFIEGAEHAGLSASPERRRSNSSASLAAVAAEILVQQIDHRPEVAAFLDVHLEQVAQVVERGRGGAEMTLLLDDAGSVSPWMTIRRRSMARYRRELPGRPARPCACRN